MERKMIMLPSTYCRSSFWSAKGRRVTNRHTEATASTQATPDCPAELGRMNTRQPVSNSLRAHSITSK